MKRELKLLDGGDFTRVCILAAVFAVLFDILLYGSLFSGMPLGVNVPVMVCVFYAALFVSERKNVNLAREHNWFLLVLILGLSVTFALYNNGLLLFLNAVAILLLGAVQIALMTGRYQGEPYSFEFGTDVCHVLFIRPYHRIGAVFKQLFGTGENENRRKKKLGIIVGIAVALPLVIILTALLASGDMAFSSILQRLFRIEMLGDVIGWAIVFVLIAMVASSGLSSLRAEGLERPMPKKAEKARFNLTAIYIILCAVDALMLIFSFVQLVYMTGTLGLPGNYTYSEYARTGFFQLLAAAVINFALVALCERFTRHAENRSKKGLNILYTILSVSTVLLIVSAFLRMVMYEQAYQFTQMRLYVQAFMVLLLIVSVWMSVKIWVKKFRMAKIVILTTAVCLLALSFFNVDAFVAKNNVAAWKADHGSVTGEDLGYLLTLSVDAAPYYAAEVDLKTLLSYEEPEEENYAGDDWPDWFWTGGAYRYSEPYDREYRLMELQRQAGAGRGDIRYWNAGREQAGAAFEGNPALMDQVHQRTDPENVYDTVD